MNTKQRELLKGLQEWMTKELEEETVPVEIEDQPGVYSLAVTNAEYNDALLFGVKVNVNVPSIIWYIENEVTEETKNVNEKRFHSYDELLKFINEHSFEDILGDEYYGDVSKYEEQKYKKFVVIVTPKTISDAVKSVLKERYDVDEVFVFGNGTEPLKKLLEALKVEDPMFITSNMEIMLDIIYHELYTDGCYAQIKAIFLDGATKGTLSGLIHQSTCTTPDTLGIVTEDGECQPVFESMELF